MEVKELINDSKRLRDEARMRWEEGRSEKVVDKGREGTRKKQESKETIIN